MNTSRHTEVNVLGYRIDHVRAHPLAPAFAGTDSAMATGLDSWREVLCPDSGLVLARFSSRADAERYIIDRELENARRAVHSAPQAGRCLAAGCSPLAFVGAPAALSE
jgi:hypothetical protein